MSRLIRGRHSSIAQAWRPSPGRSTIARQEFHAIRDEVTVQQFNENECRARWHGSQSEAMFRKCGAQDVADAPDNHRGPKATYAGAARVSPRSSEFAPRAHVLRERLHVWCLPVPSRSHQP